MITTVRITIDEAKFRSCPDSDEDAFTRWFPVRGTEIRVVLPPQRRSSIADLWSNCDGLFWRVVDVDRRIVRDIDDKTRWICEHCIDAD